MIYVVPLVILVTFPALLYAACWVMATPHRESRAERLADPAPLPGELPVAGRFPLPAAFGHPQPDPAIRFELTGPWGSFDDTGPLLIVSETTAAGIQLERDVAAMIADAEQRIPPRWR